MCLVLIEQNRRKTKSVCDRLILIELKGSDIDKGIDQFLTTLHELIFLKEITIDVVDARMVTSKTKKPNFRTPKEKMLKTKLYGYGKGTFEVSTKKYEETI